MIKKIIKIPSLPKETKTIIRELAKSQPQLDKLFEYVSQCMVWAYKSGRLDGELESIPVKIKRAKRKNNVI